MSPRPCCGIDTGVSGAVGFVGEGGQFAAGAPLARASDDISRDATSAARTDVILRLIVIPLSQPWLLLLRPRQRNGTRALTARTASARRSRQ